MQQNLPAETLQIQPEYLEVANHYLQCGNVQTVADDLELTAERVSEILRRPEVRGYVSQVYLDTGYNNRFLMRRAVDALIKRKFQELEEADVGSNKDITELLTLSHKMTMDYLDREIQLEKLRQGNAGPQCQVNVQINELDSSKYAQLVQKLISGDGV